MVQTASGNLVDSLNCRRTSGNFLMIRGFPLAGDKDCGPPLRVNTTVNVNQKNRSDTGNGVYVCRENMHHSRPNTTWRHLYLSATADRFRQSWLMIVKTHYRCWRILIVDYQAVIWSAWWRNVTKRWIPMDINSMLSPLMEYTNMIQPLMHLKWYRQLLTIWWTPWTLEHFLGNFVMMNSSRDHIIMSDYYRHDDSGISVRMSVSLFP